MSERTENDGRVVQVMGPVVDVEFPPGQLPDLYNAITINAEVKVSPSS